MKKVGISQTKRIWLALLFLLTFSIVIAFTINVVKSIPQWTGFGEDSNKSKTVEKTIKDGKVIGIKITETEQFQSPKTLWDLLGLLATLAIPLVLYLFQVSEQRRSEERTKVEKEQADELSKLEKAIAEDSLREQVFEAYIDRIAQILINQTTRTELFKNGGLKDNSIRDVARMRTVTILRRLEGDTKRQNRIIDFLRDAELLKFLLKNADFKGINLEGINFSGIDFSRAVFVGAKLSNANFSKADLSRADFSSANLRGANFTEAELFSTIFNDSYLEGANIRNADIREAKFINANLSNAILINALSWDEEEVDNNFYYPTEIGEDGDYWQDSNPKYYETDFSGAILVGANLKSANLKGEANLSVEQLKQARNWDEVFYHKELFEKLGLPKRLSQFIDNLCNEKDMSLEDIDIKEFIGKPIEIREIIDEEKKTVIKGEIVDFNSKINKVKIKTIDGKYLEKVRTSKVYIYYK
jgi:uncharacterized protein YjbI with pentapeptide repeats